MADDVAGLRIKVVWAHFKRRALKVRGRDSGGGSSGGGLDFVPRVSEDWMWLRLGQRLVNRMSVIH